MAKSEKDYINEITELKAEIDAFQMSENEANEIIAELESKNKIILDRLTQYEEDADVQVCLFSDVKRLEQENAELKEEVETRDNLVEHFRKEAINWAKISNDCIKDIENYKQTLQEIKTIAEENKDIVQYGGICRSILMELTKAEEE